MVRMSEEFSKTSDDEFFDLRDKRDKHHRKSILALIYSQNHTDNLGGL
jgi:hypothetical protein